MTKLSLSWTKSYGVLIMGLIVTHQNFIP